MLSFALTDTTSSGLGVTCSRTCSRCGIGMEPQRHGTELGCLPGRVFGTRTGLCLGPNDAATRWCAGGRVQGSVCSHTPDSPEWHHARTCTAPEGVWHRRGMSHDGHNHGDLCTFVWTIFMRWCLRLLMTAGTSTQSSPLACWRRMSRATKVPLRPTPALCGDRGGARGRG